MNKKTQTINTYSDSAESLAEKFYGLGARVDDIQEIFDLVQKKNPRVLEIGCCNGRDAKEIIKHTDDYLGIDISAKMIELAHQKVPTANFQIADIENYIFPEKLDVVFAFASLIHAPKKVLKNILSEALTALNNNGIIRLSMKYADTYTEITKKDEFGVRTYYLYSEEDIASLAGGFEIIKNELRNSMGQVWVEVILKKDNL
ncbi:MAG: class I SAM-dependent methyltransferase [Candidatus Pacebacteria bacterium]|nr:class I SAM-dependent methyltransferase [Candidatus Paceibacterota bacterium]